MGKLIDKICKNCKRSFKTRDSKKDFCDLKCEEYYKDGIQVEPEKEKPIKTEEIKSKICVFCGKVFRKKPSESDFVFEEKKCCSKSCAQKNRFRKLKIKKEKEQENK